MRIVERVALAPFRDLRVPRLGARRAGFLLDRGDDARDDALQIADDGHLRLADLADLGRVDVDVDDLGMRGELGELARHAVGEARTRRDDQVGLGHG